MSRDDLIARIKRMAPYLAEDEPVSAIRGGAAAMKAVRAGLDVQAYGETRNHLDGAVLQISPYVRHGLISLADLRREAVAQGQGAYPFVQQLAWRDYFQRVYREHPDWIWESVEAYKTGFAHSDYASELPHDIARGETGVAAIDGMIAQLLETGYLHNHARLYLAAYVVHWRRVQWQVGAQWFLSHLLDGDPASNNLSWQWVASTFSKKPYYFNLENLQRFAGDELDVSYHRNKPLAGSYEDLRMALFPNAGGQW
jgi:deoxyribodipyrimidine photo-lyase